HHLGKAHISHPRLVGLIEKDIAGFEVTMDDAPGMGVLQSFTYLSQDFVRTFWLQLAFQSEQVFERTSSHVAHGKVVFAINLAKVVHWHEVRVIRSGCNTRFLPETTDEGGTVDQVGV